MFKSWNLSLFLFLYHPQGVLEILYILVWTGVFLDSSIFTYFWYFSPAIDEFPHLFIIISFHFSCPLTWFFPNFSLIFLPLLIFSLFPSSYFLFPILPCFPFPTFPSLLFFTFSHISLPFDFQPAKCNSHGLFSTCWSLLTSASRLLQQPNLPHLTQGLQRH